MKNCAVCNISQTLFNLHIFQTRTTDTQWRHKSKISGKLDQCGWQNMLWPYLKIWDWGWIFSRAVKAILSLGVRSSCFQTMDLLFCNLDFWSLRFEVWEIWFEKSGSRNLVREKWLTRKKMVLYRKSNFFRFKKSGWPEKKIRVYRITFLEPLFYTFLEKWLQNKCSNKH